MSCSSESYELWQKSLVLLRKIVMKISQLIKILEVQQELYGDVQVYSGGQDYPGKVVAIRHQSHNQTYYEPNCVVLETDD